MISDYTWHVVHHQDHPPGRLWPSPPVTRGANGRRCPGRRLEISEFVSPALLACFFPVLETPKVICHLDTK